MNQDQAKSLGQLLRQRRQEMGLSKRQLAGLAQVRDSTVVRLEQGRFASPSPAKLARLAAALNLPLADVFAGAGYLVPDELPSFEAYLRARYPELSARTRNRLVRHFQDLTGLSRNMVALKKESEREGTVGSGTDGPRATG
jgi:transcriptional regulator with XRE-family HTH domain